MIKKAIIAVILLVLIVGAYLVFGRGLMSNSGLVADGKITAQETATVRAAVAKLMEVPEGDEPLVAEITDASQLVSQQPFYRGAKNGDYLLIYPSTAKAVIYSPKTKKLVNVGPIQLSGQGQQATQPATPVTNTAGVVNAEAQSDADDADGEVTTEEN